MKKYGKYMKQPEVDTAKQPKVKSVLLQTYFTSLICLVLCVTMFMGTSFAWFSSEVENTGNEIYIGTLDVDLRDGEDKSLAGDANKLFDNSIRWEPGYTALETVKIVNEGDLAFKYELTFTDGEITGKAAPSLVDAAKWFDVWVYHTEDNKIPEPKDYKDIKAEGSGWTYVGTLADALGDGKIILEGEMDQAAVAADPKTAHTYTIALHMKGETVADGQEDALNGLMGQKLGLSVKLVATQMSSEKDGFGNSDYDAPDFVELTQESVKDGTLTVEASGVYRLSGNFGETLTVNVPAGATVTLDGTDANFDEDAVLLVNAPGVANAYSSLSAARSGSVTVQNVTASVLNVNAYNNETVLLQNNTLKAMSVIGGNFNLEISNNTINGNFTEYTDGENVSNKYGISLRICDYELTLNNNTVENTLSHAVGINGRQGEAASDWADCGTNNVIKSFTGNKITVNSETEGGRAALKIWADAVYAPQSAEQPNDTAKALMQQILSAETQNTFIYDGQYKDAQVIFDIDGFKTRDGVNQYSAPAEET